MVNLAIICCFSVAYIVKRGCELGVHAKSSRAAACGDSISFLYNISRSTTVFLLIDGVVACRAILQPYDNHL
jgi:hypothetical protein